MYEGRTTLTAEWQVLDTEPRSVKSDTSVGVFLAFW